MADPQEQPREDFLKDGDESTGRRKTAQEWRTPLVAAVVALLAFETLTGLSIYFLPFSVPNQFIVLSHTVIGLIVIAPYAWYQIRHWLLARRFTLTHTKFLGYAAFLTVSVCLLSGVVVTFDSAFGVRLNYAWDMIHTISGFLSVAFLLPHILLIVFRHRADAGPDRLVANAQRHFGRGVLIWTAGLVGITGLAVYAYAPTLYRNEFPADYSWKYGKNPFAPSLAMTATGGAFDPRSLAESASCGTTGCHVQIVEEWLPSAHRYAAMDPAFQSVQAMMAENNGPESTRYCGGCHDPISLFSGNKTVYTDELTQAYGYQEGISCIACHSIVQTDVQGNADYIMTQPERYIYELTPGSAAKFVSDFLIRAYPEHHTRSFSLDLYKTPEFCAACHKQFIDKEINNVGWVQLQNQYDNWRKSRWHNPDAPERTLNCQECHMRLTHSTDPAAGDTADRNRTSDDGKHRNHRFIGANQYIPALLDLPGADTQIALTEEWLRGETVIPEIADRWTSGPAIPIQIMAPSSVEPGDEVALKVVLTNNKVGHDFPTGPLDIIQAWVELTVTDASGGIVYRSGEVNDRHFIQEGSFIFKAEGIDQYGNLIDRHNLWEMVGARFRRSLFPGFSDVAEYRFTCPSTIRRRDGSLPPEKEFTFSVPKDGAGALQVSARLRYRKADQLLMNVLFGEDVGLTTRVTDLSHDSKTIRIQ